MKKEKKMNTIWRINDKHIEKYAHVRKRKNKFVRQNFLFVTCFVIFFLTVVLAIGKTKIFSPQIINETSFQDVTKPGQDLSNDSFSEYPYTYLNVSEQTSLLRVESFSLYDNCYALISRDEELQSQKIVIIQATVTEDYYNHLTHGEKIYIAFPLEIFWGGKYTIESEQLIEALLNCDSLIFYSDSIGNQHCIYHDEQCSPGKELNLGRICFCNYYSDGIIPIINSHVDYSIINNVLESCGISCNLQTEFYENIKQSEFSILQGDSNDKVSVTIQELIKDKIYGGDF